MSEKEVVATQTPEDMLKSLHDGELDNLMARVKEAQSKLQELKLQQESKPQEQEAVTEHLGVHDVANINSIIIRDLLSIKASSPSSDLIQMIEIVLKAAVIQHGRLLNVKTAEKK